MTDILKQIDEQWEAFYRDTNQAPKYLFVGVNEMRVLDEATGMITLRYKGMHVVVCERDNMLVVGDKAMEG